MIDTKSEGKKISNLRFKKKLCLQSCYALSKYESAKLIFFWVFILRVFGSIALVLPRTYILLIDKRLPLIPERNMSVKIFFGQVVVVFHIICYIQNFQLNSEA